MFQTRAPQTMTLTLQNQLLCHMFHYAAHINRYYKTVARASPGWRLHKTMLAQGRVWDWRDIFIATCACNHGDFRENEETFVSRGITTKDCDELLTLWMTTPSDLPTNLALLDIMIALVLDKPLNGHLTSENLAFARKVVDRAQDVVASITKYHPAALKSRQYAQWMLAKIAVATYQKHDPPARLPGLFLPKEDALDLPIYIPFQSEVPRDQTVFLGSTHVDKVELALSIARQLGDYQTEAMCLKQLILQSESPASVFDELMNLQREVQKDMHGALRTVLAKYLVCSNSVSRDRLREEILAMGNCTEMAPTMQWARCMMLRTLAPTDGEADRMLEESRSFYGEVTLDIESFMDNNGWVNEEMLQHRTKVSNEVSSYVLDVHVPKPARSSGAEHQISNQNVGHKSSSDRRRERDTARKEPPAIPKAAEPSRAQRSLLQHGSGSGHSITDTDDIKDAASRLMKTKEAKPTTEERSDGSFQRHMHGATRGTGEMAGSAISSDHESAPPAAGPVIPLRAKEIRGSSQGRLNNGSSICST